MIDSLVELLQAPRLDSSAPLRYDHLNAFDDLDVNGLNALLDSMDTAPHSEWEAFPASNSRLNHTDHPSASR